MVNMEERCFFPENKQEGMLKKGRRTGRGIALVFGLFSPAHSRRPALRSELRGSKADLP